jgi:hypothetical protein
MHNNNNNINVRVRSLWYVIITFIQHINIYCSSAVYGLFIDFHWRGRNAKKKRIPYKYNIHFRYKARDCERMDIIIIIFFFFVKYAPHTHIIYIYNNIIITTTPHICWKRGATKTTGTRVFVFSVLNMYTAGPLPSP